ncbi:MAG: pentapeptide repeat-containing protein [Litoreibacter sp.]
MNEANLHDANLRGAQMENANLRDTKLESASLRLANLRGARLTGTQLINANLKYVDLKGARMDGATNLRGAHFQGAALKDSDYSSVTWEQAQIDQSFGDASVLLPDEIQRPRHWSIGKLDENTYNKALARWRRDPEKYMRPPNLVSTSAKPQ